MRYAIRNFIYDACIATGKIRHLAKIERECREMIRPDFCRQARNNASGDEKLILDMMLWCMISFVLVPSDDMVSDIRRIKDVLVVSGVHTSEVHHVFCSLIGYDR